MNLNELADELLADKHVDDDEVQGIIHQDILIRYNSINVIVGKRGSGKTYFIARELIKLSYAPGNRYSQVYYITDKEQDQTFDFAKNCVNPNVEITTVKTKDAMKVIKALSLAKARLNDDDNDMYRKALNADNLNFTPHTLIIFDDCIGLFKHDSSLSKKLFENRQPHITYVLILQDIGLATSIKCNLDMMVLFGGFSRQKFAVLTYQLPPIDGFDFEMYSTLGKNDYVAIDYNDDSVIVKYRE